MITDYKIISFSINKIFYNKKKCGEKASLISFLKLVDKRKKSQICN